MFPALAQYIEPLEKGVSVWTANLDALSEDERNKLSALLDAAEHARAARFHFDKDRQRYVLARALLRHLLGDALGIEPAALVFGYGAKGKPMVAGSLRFNISHSGGWAMFAFARDRDVGIDLEGGAHLGVEKDLGALASRILSARELAIWRALPDAASRRAAFLRAWTRKESYAKALGEGIFEQLRAVELILDAPVPARSIALGEWAVYDLSAPKGFAAALAIDRT